MATMDRGFLAGFLCLKAMAGGNPSIFSTIGFSILSKATTNLSTFFSNRKEYDLMRLVRNISIVFLAFMFLTSSAFAAERLKLSSTTSTDNTGLLAYLLPKFEDKTGIKVDVIAVGTGKALKLAENGDVDVTLVHAPAREIKFVEEGHGVNRREVMANYFVIVGPENDPAGVKSTRSAEDAFKRIAENGLNTAKKFDIKETAKEIYKTYQDLF